MYFYHIRRFFIIFFVLFYLLNYFFNLPIFADLYRILLIFVVLQSLPQLPRVNLLVSLGLFMGGGIILLIKGGTWQDWLIASSNNAGLITLFISVPLMGLPFFYEDYVSELKRLAQLNIRNTLTFCLLVFVVTHILGLVISLGVIPLVYEIFIGSARFFKVEKLFLISLLHGYITTGFWSPVWASMAAVTDSLKLSWASIMPYGIFFVFVCLAISLLFQYGEIIRHPELNYRPVKNPGVNVKWPYIVTLLVLAASLILIILLLNLFISWQLLIIIPVVSWLFPLASAVVMKKMSCYKQGLAEYYQKSILNTKNEVVLFAAAGFMGKSLEMSGIGHYIPRLIPEWLSQYPFITIILICLLMVIFSLTGIHPIVTGSALLGAINPVALNLSPMVFGLAILLGWDACILISPFSATNIIASGLSGEACWNISLGKNGFYGTVVIITISFLITMFIR